MVCRLQLFTTSSNLFA
uniref:Uncharacterized protein n=1 Tax=Anguilla anguilla TaxID=7936 RepID=A0A0E9UTC7_ANGAN